MTEDIVRSLGHLTLGSRLKRLGERMQAETQQILDEHQLAVQAAQFPFLAAIDRLGASTVGDLARAVGVSQPGATRTLNQLAKAGYVTMKTAPDDQRRKLITLAKKGRQLVETGKRDVWPRIDAAVRDLCEGASGPLLDQLTAIEDGLVALPLQRRPPAEPRARRRAGGRR